MIFPHGFLTPGTKRADTWELSAIPARTWSILCVWRKILCCCLSLWHCWDFFHAKIPSFSRSGTDLTSSSITRGRSVSLKSLTGSPESPGQACSRTLIQTPLHVFVSWHQILKGLGRFLMRATAGILRTTEVWTCENTFLVPYACECCTMDVAEVGQSKEQCQQHGSPSTTAISFCPHGALASRCQQVVSSSAGRLFKPFAMWDGRNLVPGTLPLRGTVVSSLLSWDLEGFRRDKAALIAKPRGRGHGQLFPSAQVRVSLLLSTEAMLSCMLYLYHAWFHFIFWLA